VFSWDAGGDMMLRSERLMLRTPGRSDLGPLHDAIMESLEELVRWLPWARPSHRRADSRQYLRHARIARSQRSAFEFLILDGETEELYGMASLHRIDWLRRSAGLGYWIRKTAWGTGVATEAAEALLTHAFQVLELYRVEAHVAIDNKSSQRVIDKLGFTREGVARGVEVINGRYMDHIQYSLLRTDTGERPR